MLPTARTVVYRIGELSGEVTEKAEARMFRRPAVGRHGPLPYF